MAIVHTLCPPFSARPSFRLALDSLARVRLVAALEQCQTAGGASSPMSKRAMAMIASIMRTR